MPGDSEIEIRQVFDAEDFGAAYTLELREQEQRLRAQVAGQAGDKQFTRTPKSPSWPDPGSAHGCRACPRRC